MATARRERGRNRRGSRSAGLGAALEDRVDDDLGFSGDMKNGSAPSATSPAVRNPAGAIGAV